MSELRLNWRYLVDSVRRDQLERVGPDGQIEFMYCEKRNVFVSDPDLIREITRARSHKEPFLLTGSMNSGKNIFLELVAKGGAQGSSFTECIDENIDGTPDQMMEKFFGIGNIVENHPGALIHFDLLQNAVDWGPFIDKVHELARTRSLYRTDGKVVTGLGVRVVGGATIDLLPLVAQRPDSSIAYLYNYLSSKQSSSTSTLGDKPERMQNLLAEMLASQVLNTQNSISESHVAAIETITVKELEALKTHTWPGGFTELVRLVREAVLLGSWREAVTNHLPGKIFIIWSAIHKSGAKSLYQMFKAAHIPAFFSEDSIGVGNWKAQISKALGEVDLVLFCITKEVFTRHGYCWIELEEVLDLHKRMSFRPFLVPVSLDGSGPSDIPYMEAADLKEYILNQQWYKVDTYSAEGFQKLYLALKRQFSNLRRSQLSEGSSGSDSMK